MSNQLTGYENNDQTITLNYEEGAPLTLKVLNGEIIRVFEDHGVSSNSYAIEGNKQRKTKYEVEDKGDHVEVTTSGLIVKAYDNRKLDVYDSEGNPLVIDYRGSRTPLPTDMDDEHRHTVMSEGHNVHAKAKAGNVNFEIIKSLSPDEQFYGLGGKTGFLNKRGYEYDNWNADNPVLHNETQTHLYKSIPVVYGLKNGHPFGIFFDNTYKSHFDLGKESEHYYFYSAVGGNVDYYIMGGHTLKDVVANYTYLTGVVPLPQKFMLGYQQSRWGYSTSDKRVESIADGFAKYKLPIDVIHLDIDYMNGYRDFTWDEKKYSGDTKAFVERMNERGIRLMPILDAGVKKDDKYDIYKEGIEKGYFVKNPDGSVYVGKVWPGDSVFPDFGNPDVRAWWAKHCKFFADNGFCGIWNDMDEPANFAQKQLPNDTVFSNGHEKSTHARMHNVYGHLQAKACYEGMKDATGKRPYIITRAAYSGTQKYSTVWTGDNTAVWAHLAMAIPQLNGLGMSGFAFAGTDIGGFQEDTTPELLTRWIEASLFVPLFRNHAIMGSRFQEPWAFNKQTLDIYRKYLNLRYRFIPFLYDQFRHETQCGLPVMRPLVLNYDQDPAVRNLNDEYMVGSKVLVAPIVDQGKTQRLVYLPAGQWIDFWNNAEYSGQQSVVAEAPIDKLPLFIKKDTILPWGNKVMHVSDEPEKIMTFRLFGEAGSYVHYQDDGTDFNYQHGEYNEYYIAVEENGDVKVKLTNHGYKPTYQKIYVTTDQDRYEFDYDEKTGNYNLVD